MRFSSWNFGNWILNEFQLISIKKRNFTSLQLLKVPFLPVGPYRICQQFFEQNIENLGLKKLPAKFEQNIEKRKKIMFCPFRRANMGPFFEFFTTHIRHLHQSLGCRSVLHRLAVLWVTKNRSRTKLHACAARESSAWPPHWPPRQAAWRSCAKFTSRIWAKYRNPSIPS